MTPRRRCYIAGWCACGRQGRFIESESPFSSPIDPNKLPPELLEAWSTGFHDALTAPPGSVCDPEEAGYED